MSTQKRLQIDISEKSFSRLKDLKDKTDSTSYSDVTQKAFKVLEYFNNAQLNGSKIQIISYDGSITEVEII